MRPAYSKDIEKQMQEVFDRLSEKDKRLYAGVEALKFPYGGISYIAQLFSCSRNTLLRGINELKEKATLMDTELLSPLEVKETGWMKHMMLTHINVFQ